MKKSSNFLKSSKDKLTKSFNSAKCKTALKLASSRLKLMRNKKEVQVKQMKRELAQLLESGQNQSARIRVEHVVREEKMMAAYDLLEIYCELIVARLPIIESQKNCPIDLKEAIASVVFASPRCGDIPELVDVRKQLTVKYGKEFISGAVELRRDCGVSRLLVEKLSAKAPDGQTKLKILTSIAEDQGVKWDPNSFGESDFPPSDLLNGPNAFEKATKLHEEPPPFQSPDVRTPPTYSQVSYESSNASEQKSGSSTKNQSFASAQGGTGGTFPSSSQPEQRHSGSRSERTEVGQSFPEDGNLSMGRQSWNMEFRDAESAAQATAEYAERASMAARAAAELSRMPGQYRTESQRSRVSYGRDEQWGHSGAKPEQRHQDLSGGPFTDRNSRSKDEISGAEHDNMINAGRKHYHDGGGTGKSSGSQGSLRSEVSIDNDMLRSPQEPDRYRERYVSREEHEVKKVHEKHSGEFEPQHRSDYEEDINYFGEERTTTEVSNVPFASHSSTSRYGDSRNDQTFRYNAGNDLFANAEEGHVDHGSTKTSYDVASAAFDKSSSDDEDDGNIDFDTGPIYDDQESKFYFPSPERKSPIHPSTTGDYWSPRLNISKSPEKSTYASQFFVERHSPPESPKSLVDDASGGDLQTGNFGHATFDDSDGVNSETEDIDQSELIGKHSQTHGLRSGEVGGTERKILSHSSYDRDSGNAYREGSDDELLKPSEADGAKDDVHLSHSTGAWTDDEKKSTQSDSDYGSELNFGRLRGGLRHKGYTIPPYMRAHQNDVPSSVDKSEENSATRAQSTVSQSVASSVHSGSMKKESKPSSRTLHSQYDLDIDSSDEEHLRLISSDMKKPNVMQPGKKVETKPKFKAPATYFDSTDSEEDSPKQTSTNKKLLASQFSRRTKISPPGSSDTNSSSRVHTKSETSGSSLERKPTHESSDARKLKLERDTTYSSNESQDTRKASGKSYAAETQEPRKDPRKSYDVGRQGMLSQQEGKSVSKSKTDLDEERQKTSTTQQSSSNAESSTSSGTSFGRVESTNKPSHVHPKLPDYDTIAAKLQSLRMNRE